MDLANLALVLRVADLGSFSAVAREADLNPSSVSRAVAAVEDRLGLRLFQRTSRTLSLTAEGEAYLRRVAPLAEQMEEARQEARADRLRPTGLLRLTASVAYGTRRIVPMLPHLRAAAPNIEIELILSDANLDMVAERIDLAVRLAAAPEGELISSRLHGTRYRVVASPSWVSAHGPLSSADDLGPDRLPARDIAGPSRRLDVPQGADGGGTDGGRPRPAADLERPGPPRGGLCGARSPRSSRTG